MSICNYAGAKDSLHGAHLASAGSYQNAITSLFNKYPNLKNRDWKVPRGYECRIYKGKAVLLELHEKANARQEDFRDEGHLREWLRDSPPPSNHKRLYLLDCLHPDYVSVFGEHFGINPRLFMRQQRTALWEFGHKDRDLGRGNTPSLPSCQDASLSFTLEYCELRWIPDDFKIEGPSMRCGENSRHINLLRNKGAFDHTGIMHRKASFWSRCNGVGGWDALLILDPCLQEALVGPGNSAYPKSIATDPYQGGYQDFIQYHSLSEAQQTPGPPRTSMLDDICYYWTHHGNLITTLDSANVSLVFLSKIVASNYLHLTEYLNGLANELSFRLSRTFEAMDIPSLERDWNDLQSWILRPREYIDRVEEILARQDVVTIGEENSWTDTKPDFELIKKNLVRIQGQCEGFVNSFMGLAGIVGNRQALQGAKSVHILTVLGTFFVPLSFAATLFSMNGIYLPGAVSFTTYIATALPLAAIVTTIAFCYETMIKWSRKKATFTFLK